MPPEHFLTNEAEYWTAFSRIEKIGASKLKKIRTFFSSLKEAWEKGDTADFIHAGLDPTLSSFISNQRSFLNPKKELEFLKNHSISLIAFSDNKYPPLLKEIPDFPAVLFCRGNLGLLHEHYPLGVVGTRKMTSYGKEAVDKIVGELTQAGFTIVSGMAMGIDGEAHRVALDQKGKTIAVVASGVDDDAIYPRINFPLAQRIIAEGLLISEFPPGTKPREFYFPFRNRIIAGLSRGVLVIEAPQHSGTTLTATYALEYNREVFAVPNPIFSVTSAVPNNLLKNGAIPVEGAQDVIRTFGLDQSTMSVALKTQLPETPEEETILKLLSHQELHVDDIIRHSNLDIQKVSVTLTLMEMKGMVKRLEGMYFRKL